MENGSTENVGRSVFELIHPDDQVRAFELFAELMQEPRRVAQIELRALHKDGTWRRVEAVGVNQDDEQVLAFVREQLVDPQAFLNKVRELYARPEASSFDVLTFKDGRIFERLSQPQRIGGKST